MPYLRQSTSQTIRFGPCLDITDGVTEETALTLAQADMRLSKDGGAFAQKNASGNATHDSDGWYSTTLNTTDTNTVGELILNVHQPANMLPVWMRWWVLEEEIYDNIFGASAAGLLDVNVIQVSGDATAANNLEADYDGTGFNKSNSTIGTCTTNTDMRGTDSAATAAALATVDTNVDAILVDTAEIGAAGAGLTALASAANLATVDSNVDAILVDTGTTLPGTLATIDSNVDAILVDTGTTLDTKLNDIQGATFSSATDSLEAIRDRGDAAWTTGAGGTPPHLLQTTTIATLASQTSFTLTAGSADNDAYNGAIAVITDSSTSTQKAVGTVSDYVGSTRTVTLSADPGIFTMAVGDTIDIMSALGSAGNAPTAVEVRQEMDNNSTQLAAIVADTNELQGDWVNGGRLDLILDARASQASVDTVDSNVDAILVDTGTTLPASLSTIDSNVDAVLVDTGTTLPATLATIDGNVDSILADTGTTLPASLSAIETDTQNIQSRLPASLVSGRIDASVGAMAANVLTAAAINSSAITAAKLAAGAIDANALATDAVTEIANAILPEPGAALSNIPFGFVAASDHVTPVTGATGISAQRSIDGAAFATATGTVSEVANGDYSFDASAADMNGGIIRFRFSATGGTPGAPDDTYVTVITRSGV